MKILLTVFFTFVLTISPALGCFILFLTDGKNILVANHEDWYARDAEVTFIPAIGGKKGMVYFDFISEKTAQGGMNTAGLFFDGTRTPHASYPSNEKKEDCKCYIWTKILAECNNVDEAIAYIQRYRVPELEDVHILFADKWGRSAVVGVYEGKLQVHRRMGRYQLLTNFNQSNPSNGGEPACSRFAAADSMLHHDSSATVDNAQRILAQTAQDALTIYSNIYNLSTGDIYIYSYYTRNNFHVSARLNLMEELKKGRHAVPIVKLFNPKNYTK